MIGREVFIVEGVRTPRGKGSAKGALAGVSALGLVGALLDALTARAPGLPELADDLVLGCATQVDGQGTNIARTAALLSGWDLGAARSPYCASLRARLLARRLWGIEDSGRSTLAGERARVLRGDGQLPTASLVRRQAAASPSSSLSALPSGSTSSLIRSRFTSATMIFPGSAFIDVKIPCASMPSVCFWLSSVGVT